MPDSLNARMAAALAPVLGEAAVYNTTFRCSEGHPTSSRYVREGSSCPWILDDERECLLPVTASEKIPVDFADPAVGWGVLERYLKATSSYLTLDHNTEGSVFEAHVFPDLAYQFVHEGYADTAWGAVIMAWAQALGVSGDE